MVKYDTRLSEMFLKAKKWSKNLQISVKFSRNVLYGLNWYLMVLNSLKKSTINSIEWPL